MPNQAFKLDYKLFLEGAEVDFKSANVVSTPGGNMASIGILSNRFAHDLLPKTSVQIFYKQWVPSLPQGWHLMFDGFISNVSEQEASTEGRMLNIEARDFVTDLNKIPAAIVWESMEGLGGGGYSFSGVHRTTVIPNKSSRTGTTKYSTRTYTNPGGGLSSRGLLDLSTVTRWVAGGAQGGNKRKSNGESIYKGRFSATFAYDNGSNIEGNLFLDSFARGIWMDSVGGTSMGAFMNKRLRADKKLVIPSNDSGYKMYSRNAGSINIGSYLMGNAKFTSVMASIMRMSALFSSKLTCIASPTAIYIGDDKDGNPSTASAHVIDKRVREFIVKENEDTFGGQYLINECMILPPLEFTAPPDCNLILPTMYDNVAWRHDYDADVTRGMFKQADIFSSAETGSSLSPVSIQVPNALFNLHGNDKHGRKKPPLTLEERYKGVNPMFSNVAYILGEHDARSSYKNGVLNSKARGDLNAKITELQDELDGVITAMESGADIPAAFKTDLTDRIKKKKAALGKRFAANNSKLQNNAVKRHALIKFLNNKYAGRVLQVGMCFNPYIMAGFPSIIYAGIEATDSVIMKDIIGHVQQVEHRIVKTTGGADATTSVVLQGARFVEDPTDMDEYGNPLYSVPTNRSSATIDSKTTEYDDKNYAVGDSSTRVKQELNSKYYDLSKVDKESGDYIYAKDFLTLTSEDKAAGESNNQYLDDKYTPNRIAKFYKDSLGMRDSFMVGKQNGQHWMFDTIHEASDFFKNSSPYIYNDLTLSLERVYRRVCSAEQFYGGVMGASVKDDKTGEYVVNKTPETIDNSVIRDRYYGVSTFDYYNDNDVQELKKENGGLLTGEGKFSSILETEPVTAFIQERRDSVISYINSIKNSSGYTRG